MLIGILIPPAYRNSLRLKKKDHPFVLSIIVSQQEICDSRCILNTRIVPTLIYFISTWLFFNMHIVSNSSNRTELIVNDVWVDKKYEHAKGGGDGDGHSSEWTEVIHGVEYSERMAWWEDVRQSMTIRRKRKCEHAKWWVRVWNRWDWAQ